jgi:hypothetical protein
MDAPAEQALPRERTWIVAAGLLVLAAVAARIHNAFAFPALRDFDGPGHALNLFALYEGRLPDTQSWSGFHPPLYYAVAAGLWHVLPESVPVHAALRLLSLAAGLGTAAIVWRVLRRDAAAGDAAAVVALVLCAPVMALATSMFGNETLCALLVTAALARSVDLPPEPLAAIRRGASAVAWAGLAALVKSTGLIAVGVIGLVILWHVRTAGARTLGRAVLVLGGIAGLLLAPHYGRLLAEGRPVSSVMSGGIAGAAASQMALQPPGERHLSDYVTIPISALVAPFKDGAGMVRSVPGLLYATAWADGQGEFLPAQEPRVVGAASLAALLGLLPTLLGLRGLVAILRSPAQRTRMAAPLCFAALLCVAFLVQTWVVPRFSAVKASYLLAASLPAALALAAGLARSRHRAPLRAGLLITSAWATFLTWYGWWS